MTTPIDQLTVLPPCDQPLEIVREASTFVVVNKPPRLLTVPGRHPANRDSVIERFRAAHPQVHAVHRLDFDTSGLLVVPLTKASLSHLSRQFQARSVSKTYTAVVQGIVNDNEGEINLPMAPDPERRPRSKITNVGKPALTRFKVLERDEPQGRTRLALYPVTGRSHQLRLHCQAMGHAILGCEFYAPPEVAAMAPRLLLHASSLEFECPETGETLSFSSPAPF